MLRQRCLGKINCKHLIFEDLIIVPLHVALECPDEFTSICVIETDGLAVATGDQSLTIADRHDGGGGAGPDCLLLHPRLPVPDTHSLQKSHRL